MLIVLNSICYPKILFPNLYIVHSVFLAVWISLISERKKTLITLQEAIEAINCSCYGSGHMLPPYVIAALWLSISPPIPHKLLH